MFQLTELKNTIASALEVMEAQEGSGKLMTKELAQALDRFGMGFARLPQVQRKFW
jgi:hypothetical protein